MSKFYILDDCKFGAPYLLYLEFVFDKNYWIGYEFKSRFCGKFFNSIQNIMKIWHTF